MHTLTALLEQNHKIKDWRIDIKKAVSKDSGPTNQGYSSNRNEGRAFGGGFGNFGRGFSERGRGGGPAPWNSSPMGGNFGNDGFGGGWGGGMGGNIGCDMGGGMGDGIGGSMGGGMDGCMGGGMGGMGSGMGGGIGGGMGGGGMGGGLGSAMGGMGGGMGNDNRNNPWTMQSSSMGGGGGGNMGGMNASWENQGGRGNGNNFGNEDSAWGRGSNMDNDNMGGMMGAGFSTGMGGGSLPNRGMPPNGGMGCPGPMRNHIGGGNVCRAVKYYSARLYITSLLVSLTCEERYTNQMNSISRKMLQFYQQD